MNVNRDAKILVKDFRAIPDDFILSPWLLPNLWESPFRTDTSSKYIT